MRLGGFTTHDIARCRLAARLLALFYHWWNIFVRPAEPDRHLEAITGRPLPLHAIATRIRHARQTALKIASSHAKAIPLHSVIMFLHDLAKNAEQLPGPTQMEGYPLKSLPGLPKWSTVAPAPRLAAS
jgi:hypothetical protein